MAQSASFKVLSITGLYANETLKRRHDNKTKTIQIALSCAFFEKLATKVICRHISGT